MKKLSFTLTDELQKNEGLVEDISVLGHQIISHDNIKNVTDVDYFLCCHANDFFNDIQKISAINHQPIENKIVLCLDDKVALYQGNNSALLIQSLEAGDTKEELIVDAVISLSQNEDDHQFPEIDIDPETVQPKNLLSPDDYDQVINEWNKTDRPYPDEITTHQLFEQQVEKTPNNIALTFENKNVTYQQLNVKANQLARHIRRCYREMNDKPLEPDTLIGICLGRGIDAVISIFAILKAGAAYVPIEPSHPQERINYILEDSGVQLVITQSQFSYLCKSVRHIIVNEKNDSSELVHNLQSYSQARYLAYVIYTSGTTGKPKGVMIEHHSLNNFAYAQQERFKIGLDSTVLQYASYAFDVSVLEIFVTLLSGAHLDIIPGDYRQDPYAVTRYLKERHITAAILPPALISHMPYEDLPDLTNLMTGGETCSLQLVEQWSQGRLFFNQYGPTECTVCATIHDYQRGDSNNTIGKPLANTKLYILDSDLGPVPVAETGELYIGGAGLARGYHNRAELTGERFIDNPFATASDISRGYTRLYKTGDVVKWLPNGCVEYVGRNDFQVKIRGHRIELGEIETALSKLKSIKQACVLAKDGKETDDKASRYLIAYYIGENPDISEKDLRAQLSQVLPDYMLPSIWVKMDALPVTISGKVDKSKLLAMSNASQSSKPVVFNPRNKYEQFIGELWLELLPGKVRALDSSCNFLELGGHSLLLTRIILSIDNEFGATLKLSDIFDHITLGELADYVEGSVASAKSLNTDQGTPCVGNDTSDEVHGNFNLTDIQEAYYLGRDNAFVLGGIPAQLYLELEFTTLNIKQLERAINQTIRRHGALRTIFYEHRQVVIDNIVSEFILKKGETLTLRDQMASHIFNLQLYPLFDIKYSEQNSRYILHCCFDAIIVDVYSLSIIFKDISDYYNHQTPAPLSITFGDYIRSKQQAQKSEVYIAAKGYWQEKLDTIPDYPQINLKDNPSSVKEIRFSHLVTFLDSEKTQKLRALASSSGISLTTIFLYCYGLVLSRYSGNSKLLLNLTLFDRDHAHPDINKVVGDFTTLVLFSFDRSAGTTALETLKQNQQALWRDLNHKHYNGIQVSRDIRKQKSYAPGRLVAPYIFTSSLGYSMLDDDFMQGSYQGINYESAQTAQCILESMIREGNSGIYIDWYYVEQLLDAELAHQMHADYGNLIEQLIESDWQSPFPDVPLSLNEQTIIEQANSATQPKVTENLVDICWSSIKQHATKCAVIDSVGSYTYDQIGRYSYAIAGYLHDYKLSLKNHLVGVLSEKGYQQLVAPLGIMQSGSAYLPLHVDWPDERCNEILKQGGVKTVLISQKEFLYRVRGSGIEADYIWLIIENTVNYQPETPLEQLPKIALNDIAYVIFTSGSTGKPKGVTLTHSGVVNTIKAVNDKFKIDHTDRLFALSELSFDLSVYDLFGMLAAGATIVFPEQEKVREPGHWYELVRHHQITLWNTVPQLVQLLVGYVEDNQQPLDTLKVVMMSGDWIPTKLPAKLQCLNKTIDIMSLGGATEGSIWSVWYEITDVKPDWNSIPYGCAMPNQQMYILNDHREHNPIGVVGEIYIGGEGVALAYWNNSENTQNSFIAHPVLGKLYKTGDLGKWNAAGYIEFEGRKDSQVKISGYRIETGEIEAAIDNIDFIKKSYVLAKDRITKPGKIKQLVAYYLLDDLKNIANEYHISEDNTVKHCIRQQLSKKLPDYMLPSILIELDSLPLTSNGKLDFSALPDIEPTATKENYIAPRNKTEKILSEMWAQLLILDDISIEDDFFDLGSTSFHAIQLAQQIQKAFNSHITVADIFRSKTIARLAEAIFSENSSSLIKAYNKQWQKHLPTMIFIHPGNGGSEVYQHLAESLADRFNCISVDNYNLYHPNKISSLNQLAQYYLDEYERHYALEENINLLGWSLGGHISLEMAGILEERGYQNINLILLDAVLPDETLKQLSKNIDHCSLKSHMRDMFLENYPASYVEKIIDAYDAEYCIEITGLSYTLQHTRVFLHKATQPYVQFNNQEFNVLNDYVLTLLQNNIEHSCSYVEINNVDCHHWDILQKFDVTSIDIHVNASAYLE